MRGDLQLSQRTRRNARLNQRIGAIHPQELRRVRLGVAAVIGLSELLTAANLQRATRP
jgi:mRNA interferase MazF